MSSILLFLAVAAVLMLVVWVIRNDAPGLNGGDKGLFAMKPAEAPASATQPAVRWRRR